MIIIKHEISNRRGKILEKEINNYISKNNKIICKGLKRRPVFINEYLSFINGRNDKNNRMRCFYSAIELIKKAENTSNKQIIGDNLYSYEFKGITNKGFIVGVHIKEFYEGKNKVLKLISTFWG